MYTMKKYTSSLLMETLKTIGITYMSMPNAQRVISELSVLRITETTRNTLITHKEQN